MMQRPLPTDPVARAIGQALRPGHFISYNAGRSFITALEAVEAQLKTLVDRGQAAHAIPYYELFIAACEEKANDINDSANNFTNFVAGLFCGWVQAREAAGFDATDTATQLLAWMEDDPWSFCYGLERHLVPIYSPQGLSAFSAAVRARLAAITPADAAPEGTSFAGLAQQLTEALKYIAVSQGDIPTYLQLCLDESLTPPDCETVAGMYLKQGNAAEALLWVDRGLAQVQADSGSQRFGTHLPALHRDVLHALGRTDEVIASAWEEFVAHPSTWTYQTLMRYVPEADRARWHAQAMDTTTQKGDLGSLLLLWCETQEIDRLVTRLRETDDLVLVSLLSYTMTPVAQALAASHPEIAARLYRTLGLQILAQKKSREYDTALTHFLHAKHCYELAGQTAVWQAVVDFVRQQHGRKYGFMPAFERIVQGEPDPPPPTFLERAARRSAAKGQ